MLFCGYQRLQAPAHLYYRVSQSSMLTDYNEWVFCFKEIAIRIR